MHKEILTEISAERARQVLVEGYKPEHDDEHTDGSIAMAAACYAAPIPIHRAERRTGFGPGDTHYYMDAWPWDRKYDKRRDTPRRRQLIKAAALIIAEIERLDRSQKSQEDGRI